MTFRKKTIDRLCERVGGKCSNPNCRRETKGPHSNPQKRVSIGEAAHIPQQLKVDQDTTLLNARREK